MFNSCFVPKVAAIAILAVAGVANAATVSLSGAYSIDSASDFNISSGPYSPASLGGRYYQLTVGATDVTARFSLIDTLPEGLGNVSYSLYTDADAGAGGNTGTLLKTVTYTDVSDVAAAPFFQQLLTSGKQYILQITRSGNSWQEINTNISAVPLPGAIWMFGTALLGFLGFSNRRKI
jgi:hypothetical protein